MENETKNEKMQLQHATAVCVTRHIPSQRDCDGIPLLDAAASNGVNSSTFSVAAWWLYGLVAGPAGLVCREKEARATVWSAGV